VGQNVKNFEAEEDSKCL